MLNIILNMDIVYTLFTDILYFAKGHTSWHAYGVPVIFWMFCNENRLKYESK